MNLEGKQAASDHSRRSEYGPNKSSNAACDSEGSKKRDTPGTTLKERKDGKQSRYIDLERGRESVHLYKRKHFMDLGREDHACQATRGRRKRKLGSREMEENLKRTANKRGCAAEVVKCRMKCRLSEGEEQH